jgi:drug/metabolite transporter (DMT)-like permease
LDSTFDLGDLADNQGLGVLLNNLSVLLPVGIGLVATREYEDWSTAFGGMTADTALLLGISCVLGLCVGVTMLAAQRLVTATNFSMLQLLTRFLIIAGSAIILDEQYGAIECVGVGINVAGGVWYVVAQSRDEGIEDDKTRQAAGRTTVEPLASATAGSS